LKTLPTSNTTGLEGGEAIGPHGLTNSFPPLQEVIDDQKVMELDLPTQRKGRSNRTRDEETILRGAEGAEKRTNKQQRRQSSKQAAP
jgi:hypothetical protein